jgi:hemoglobin
MKHDILLPADVKHLVDTFYEKARTDAELGHIFNDIAQVNWEHHLPRMYAFWEFLLLGTEGFLGNPMAAHQALAQKYPLTEAHFDQWVALFQASVDALFVGPTADSAKMRAFTIAETWKPKFTGKFH